MYIENAAWARDVLAGLRLREGARALDIGSSTLHYRTVEQPHVQREVMAPLLARGVRITHLDAKESEGVDVVQDLDAATPKLAERLGTFDLVLCIGLLGYVKDRANTLDVVASLVGEGGWLVSTTPESYRRTLDPYDNMWRPTPRELAAEYELRGLRTVRAESVRIDDRRYYRGFMSRPSWVPVRERFWFPLPLGSDLLRRRVPRWRWRESCVLAQRVGSPSGLSEGPDQPATGLAST
jgi:SAM-dependent methyltransferase